MPRALTCFSSGLAAPLLFPLVSLCWVKHFAVHLPFLFAFYFIEFPPDPDHTKYYRYLCNGRPRLYCLWTSCSGLLGFTLPSCTLDIGTKSRSDFGPVLRSTLPSVPSSRKVCVSFFVFPPFCCLGWRVAASWGARLPQFIVPPSVFLFRQLFFFLFFGCLNHGHVFFIHIGPFYNYMLWFLLLIHRSRLREPGRIFRGIVHYL